MFSTYEGHDERGDLRESSTHSIAECTKEAPHQIRSKEERRRRRMQGAAGHVWLPSCSYSPLGRRRELSENPLRSGCVFCLFQLCNERCFKLKLAGRGRCHLTIHAPNAHDEPATVATRPGKVNTATRAASARVSLFLLARSICCHSGPVFSRYWFLCSLRLLSLSYISSVS